MKTSAQRQALFRARQLERGLAILREWVHRDDLDILRACIAEMARERAAKALTPDR